MGERDKLVFAVDLGVQDRPDLAAKIARFKTNIAFVERSREELYRHHPGEMVIVQDGQVVAHGLLSGTGKEMGKQIKGLWDQLDAAGIERGSAHWAILDAPTLAGKINK